MLRLMEGYSCNEKHPSRISYSIWLDPTLIFLVLAGMHQQGLIATLAYTLSPPLAAQALLQSCAEIWPWSCVHSQADGSRCWGRQCDLARLWPHMKSPQTLQAGKWRLDLSVSKRKLINSASPEGSEECRHSGFWSSSTWWSSGCYWTKLGYTPPCAVKPICWHWSWWGKVQHYYREVSKESRTASAQKA